MEKKKLSPQAIANIKIKNLRNRTPEEAEEARRRFRENMESQEVLEFIEREVSRQNLEDEHKKAKDYLKERLKQIYSR
jgi:predicted transglutaminase-like protease